MSQTLPATVAPMSEPLPQPLPANPRPARPYPKTSEQALAESQMLAGVEAEASPEITNPASAQSSLGMQNLAMGAGAKTADLAEEIKALFGHDLDAEFNSPIEIGGDDDVFSSPLSPSMTGGQWKALKREESSNLGAALPERIHSAH